jgi:hypothetical protein
MLTQLQEIHRLLVNHQHAGQAVVVGKLIELLPVDRDAFIRLLQGVDVWGGSGAVWEVGPLGADERSFRSAIISLATQMDAQGIGSERSRFIARTFENWNRLGV